MDLRNEERFRRVTLFQIPIISAIKECQKYASYFCHTHWVVIFPSYTWISFFFKLQRLFLCIVKIHPFHYFFILGLSVEGSCVLRHQVDCDSCLFCLSWAQIHLKATRLHFMAGSSLWQLSQLSLIWSSSSSLSTFISLQAVHFDSSCGNGGGVAPPLQRPAVDHLSSNTFAQVGLLSPKHFAHLAKSHWHSIHDWSFSYNPGSHGRALPGLPHRPVPHGLLAPLPGRRGRLERQPPSSQQFSEPLSNWTRPSSCWESLSELCAQVPSMKPLEKLNYLFQEVPFLLCNLLSLTISLTKWDLTLPTLLEETMQGIPNILCGSLFDLQQIWASVVLDWLPAIQSCPWTDAQTDVFPVYSLVFVHDWAKALPAQVFEGNFFFGLNC